MQGDCLERMKEIPDGSIDLVLTDPPYNIARDNNFTTMGRAGIDFGEWDKGADLFSYIKEVSRVLTKDGSFVVFNDWKNLGDIARFAESLDFETKDMLRLKRQTQCLVTVIAGMSLIMSVLFGLLKRKLSGLLTDKIWLTNVLNLCAVLIKVFTLLKSP